MKKTGIFMWGIFSIFSCLGFGGERPEALALEAMACLSVKDSREAERRLLLAAENQSQTKSAIAYRLRAAARSIGKKKALHLTAEAIALMADQQPPAAAALTYARLADRWALLGESVEALFALKSARFYLNQVPKAKFAMEALDQYLAQASPSEKTELLAATAESLDAIESALSRA